MKKKVLALFLIVIGIIGVVNYKKITIQQTSFKQENKYYNDDVQYNSETISKIKEINIQKENIKNKYQFIAITDSHISIEDENESDLKIKETLTDRKNLYINSNIFQKSSDVIFSDVLEYAENRNVDSILMLGDIIDTPADSNLSFLKNELNELETSFLYTFGNHDWTYSWEYQTKETAQKYKPKILELMKIAESKVEKNYVKDIYIDSEVSYIEYSDLVVLAVDDGTNQITETAIPKIEMALNKNKPTLVMMHIPVATDYITSQTMAKRGASYSIGEKGVKPHNSTKKALDIILNNLNVFYIVSGHTHFEIEDVINERIPILVASPLYEGAITLIKINN